MRVVVVIISTDETVPCIYNRLSVKLKAFPYLVGLYKNCNHVISVGQNAAFIFMNAYENLIRHDVGFRYTLYNSYINVRLPFKRNETDVKNVALISTVIRHSEPAKGLHRCTV